VLRNMPPYSTLCMEVAPAGDAMRKIAASSIPISTRSGDLSFPTKANPLIMDRVSPFCRSSSWIREALESLLRAWANAAFLTRVQRWYRSACLEENTTWDLVKDIERLREHLKIEKWHVFGGSWVRVFFLSLWHFHPRLTPVSTNRARRSLLLMHRCVSSVRACK
jgi:pimeloyl-ACP methyl ester carboxylesterase